MSKRQNKIRVLLWVLLGALVCVVIGGAAYGVFGWYLPYRDAENTMPADGILELREQTDGSLQLCWPEGINTDSYTLDVLDAQGQTLYSYTTADTGCPLPASLPVNTPVTLRVSSGAAWRDKIRPGNEALEVSTLLAPPRVENLVWLTDPQTLQVSLHFDNRDHTSYNLYLSDGSKTVLLETLTKGEAELAFGENTAYPVPEFGSEYVLSFDGVREMPGLTFYSAATNMVNLCREDFLGTALKLQVNDLGNNAWQLFWNETKGEHYEVQQWNGSDWQTVATVAGNSELTYHTGHLARFEQFSFRVIAVGGQAEDIISEPVNMTTGAAAVYCTVWPQRDLDIYADTTCTQVLGTAPAARAYCVLEEKDGLFGIRVGDGIGYIDSNYCMINLPEYLEDLCAYNITNSYSSLFMVHDYEIPQVTGTVFKGYEHVRQADGTFLVPLLYPTAQKLLTAAKAAQALGYTLKIYDSYRPHAATSSVYKLAEKILNDPVPEWTFGQKRETVATEPGQTPETEDIMTYQELMTDNGRYYLGNFLAPGTSTHNLGVAMDMTLVNANGNEETMQTPIHDLSWYSEVGKNTASAKLLRQIMVDAGFVTLSSEWWHFQDAPTREALGLTALETGVSAECWMADDQGWRYRLADGTYYKDCQKTIDGISYRFDGNGYVITN